MRCYIKFFVPALVLCLIYSFSYKHTNVYEEPTGIAYYQFYHIKDSTQTGRVWTEDFMLAFSAHKSIYTSQTRASQDSSLQVKLKEAEKKNSEIVEIGLIVPTTEDDIYTDQNTLYNVKNYRQQSYLIKEALEKISWTINKETKQLLGYTCQMATGMVKGRRYTAWFTTDVPAGFGPWKLQGLPGLILEAYDDHYFIKFTCTKVVTRGSFQRIKPLDLPANLISTTNSEYERMKKADSEGLGMENFGNGLSVDKVTLNGGGESKRPKKKLTINYPLELTP